MKMRFIKSMQLVTGSVLAATVFLAGSSGMVLCIGDDGHLAVESEHHSHCGHNEQTSGHSYDAAAFLMVNAEECDDGGCVDVPLRGDEMSHAGKSLKIRVPVKISVIKDISTAHTAFMPCGFGEAYRPPSRTEPNSCQLLLEKGTIVLRV